MKYLHRMTVIAAIVVLFLTRCGNPEDPKPEDILITFTYLTANGSAADTTTRLTLIFDKDITGLKVADITLYAGTTGAVKGDLTKTGTGVYDLAVNGITAGGKVSVSVSKSGYAISGDPKTVTVYYNSSPSTNIAATFTNLMANGSATDTTTRLTLTFDKDIAGLSAADITLTAGSTRAVKGSLTRTGIGVYDLAIGGITAGGSVMVSVAKSGYNITDGSKTVTVYYYVSSTAITAAFTGLTADGSAAVTTAKLILTFDKDITGLSAADVVLDAGTTGAVKGDLIKTGTGIYNLAVGGITAGGSVTVAVSKSGYNITGGSKIVTIFYNTASTDIAAAFTDLAADGSATVTTTKLTLTFDKDITGLSAADVVLDAGTTGAVKGDLTGTGTGIYDLAVSGITAGGSVTVAVSKSGYVISGTPKTATVYGSTNTAPETVSKDRFEYYWIDEHDSLVTSSGGATIIASDATLTITAQSAGYDVKQWHLDGVNTDLSGNTYNFSSTITGKHIVGLLVEKNGKLYNTNITITVGTMVTFDINNGIGTAPVSQIVSAGSGITLPDGSGFSRTGCTFDGWNTNASGTGTNYDAGSSYTPADNITLYAKWNLPNGTEANPFLLTAGTWENGSITSGTSAVWYSFNVTSGTTYRVWWNDFYQGNSTKTLDVKVDARYPDGTAIFTGVDSAYTNAQSFTATQNDTIKLKVYPYHSGTGTFAVVYSTNSTRP